jgi:hypothetical protein
MKTVVWDVDDVLNELTAEWFRQAWQPTRGTAVRGEALVRNPPHELLGVSLEEYLASLDDFRRTRYASLAPVPEVIRWFETHGDTARHVAVTAVPSTLAHVSAWWVLRHFGRWITTFACVNARAARGQAGPMAQSKREYLAWLGRGDVLVEDREETLAACADLGVAGVLVPRPWNSGSGRPLWSALDALTAALEGGEQARGSRAGTDVNRS